MHRSLFLHCEDLSYSFGGFFLGGCSYMGVGVEGEAGGEVTEHAGDRLDIYAVLECYRSEGVAEVVESDLRDACPCQHSLEHIVDAGG